MSEPYQVAVGSSNPLKLKAAAHAMAELVAMREIVAARVESGVSPQPSSAEEAIRGAVNRACRARQSAHADLGVGIEAGVEEAGGRLFVCTWAAVASVSRYALGSSARFELPEAIRSRIEGGATLEQAIEELTGVVRAGSGAGAIGVLTHGLVDRSEATRHAVRLACAALGLQSQDPAS